MKRFALPTLPLLAIALSWLIGSFAHAQTAAPAVTLTASPSSGTSPVSVILAWSTVPAATSCTATGSGFAGSLSGVQVNGSMTLSLTATETFGLTCTWPGSSTVPPVTVTWTPPTQNTDGSALTNLTSYNLYLDMVNPPQKLLANIAAGGDSYSVASPPVGTIYVDMTAVNASGQSSAPSAVASAKVTTVTGAAVTKSANATVTVGAALPDAPTSVTASP